MPFGDVVTDVKPTFMMNVLEQWYAKCLMTMTMMMTTTLTMTAIFGEGRQIRDLKVGGCYGSLQEIYQVIFQAI